MALSYVFRFLIGAAVGSFLNVVSLRYDPAAPVLSVKRLGGRSRCPHCATELRWYELVPIVSFMLQFGKCRTCKGGLSLQYPIVELLSGLALVCIPEAIFSVFGFRFASLYGTPLILHYLLAGIFTVATLALILASAIDARLMILPDSLTAFVALLGVMSAFLIPSILDGSNGALNGSFLGSYATLSGFQDSIMANRLAAALIGALWLTLIVLVTRGRGMGIGDIKLAGALGFLLGWPDAVVGLGLGFILGALASILLLVCGKAGLKSSVPFGPFIVLGASAVVLWGRDLAAWYFNLFP